MPLPINRVPPGLLSLLDTKSGGINPLQLADELSGSIELLDFYAATTNEYEYGDSVSTNAVGQLAPLGAGDNMRVPAGEIWIVDYIAVRSGAVLGAATSVTAAVCLYNSSLGTVMYAGRPSRFITGERVCVSTDRRLVIGPNYGIGVHLSEYVGLAQVFQFTAAISKLKF